MIHLMTNPYFMATLLFYAASLALYVWNLREPSRTTGFGATACLVGGIVMHNFAAGRAVALDPRGAV